MKVAYGKTMKLADKKAIEDYGILGLVLMENAAKAVFDQCMKILENIKNPSALIVCGKGNNGGDGFALARHLVNSGVNTTIFLTSDKSEIVGDAKANLAIAEKMEIPIVSDESLLKPILLATDLVVDAIFGTGFKGLPKPPIDSIIKTINEFSNKIISIDIPSGINADTAEVIGASIKADITVSLCLPKIGNILFPACEYNGELVIAPISIPNKAIDELCIECSYLTKNEAKRLLPKRSIRSNKGTYGKVMVIGGSEDMSGAAYFPTKAAYLSGCGVVYTAIVYHKRKILQSLIPEAIIISLDHLDGFVYEESFTSIEDKLKSMSVVAIGPGLGNNKHVTRFMERLIKNTELPLVIDADGINSICKREDLFKCLKCECVITPHPGELSRLIGLSIEEILKNPIESAKSCSKKYNVVTLLKDARTIIASPKGEVYINLTGNNGMAKGGSGDVLTGIIASFIAQGLTPFKSAVLGAYIHGLAGDYAVAKLGYYSLLASDILDNIPNAIKSLE